MGLCTGPDGSNLEFGCNWLIGLHNPTTIYIHTSETKQWKLTWNPSWCIVKVATFQENIYENPQCFLEKEMLPWFAQFFPVMSPNRSTSFVYVWNSLKFLIFDGCLCCIPISIHPTRWVCLKIVYLYTQWFCWSLSLLNTYFIGGIPHFQTYPGVLPVKPWCEIRWNLPAWNRCRTTATPALQPQLSPKLHRPMAAAESGAMTDPDGAAIYGVPWIPSICYIYIPQSF